MTRQLLDNEGQCHSLRLVWVAKLQGKMSPGTTAPTRRGAKAALCNHAPREFAEVIWEAFKKRGWKISKVRKQG